MEKLACFFIILIYVISCSKNPSNTITVSKKDSSNYSWVELKNTNIYNFSINTMCTYKNRVFTAGEIGLYPSYVVETWDGGQWTIVGSGSNAQISANGITHLISDHNGNLYANAGYDQSGSIHRYVAKWDGNVWSNIGLITNNYAEKQIDPRISKTNLDAYEWGISRLVCDNQNNIYFACYEGFNADSTGIFKWDGAKWTKLGNSLKSGDFSYGEWLSKCPSLFIDNNGDLYCTGAVNFNYGGVNDTIESYLAKWNSTNWEIIKRTKDFYSLNAQSYCSSSAFGFFLIPPSSYSPITVLNWQNQKWRNIEIGTGFTTTWGPFANYGYNNLCSDKSGNVYLLRQGTSIGGGGTFISKFDGNSWYNISSTVPVLAKNPVENIVADDSSNIYVASKDPCQVFMLKKDH